jgi:4'-phosphopantetheinyl transferase
VIPLRSPADGIALWWCELRATAVELDAYATVLSAGERARAARFGAAVLRDRYVIGRAALRFVLAQTLGVAPARVPIVRGARGRPQLDDEPRIDFNVSHTCDVALLGVRRGGRIGVDVERSDRTLNVAGIARKFMSARERATIAASDADGARRTLLTLWTCKEAMSKATGDALSAPFAAIDVDVSGARTPRAGPGKYRPDAWALHAAGVPDGFIGTVAVWSPSNELQ